MKNLAIPFQALQVVNKEPFHLIHLLSTLDTYMQDVLFYEMVWGNEEKRKNGVKGTERGKKEGK